jgi:hypothetical protein
MAERKYTHGLKLRVDEGVVVIDIGSMEIWDGADLSLIRDTLFRLIAQEETTAVGVNMRYVQYIPSGFFGMLYDWLEQGIQIRLYFPRPRVQRMLWFRRFFTPLAPGVYGLHDGMDRNWDLEHDPHEGHSPACQLIDLDGLPAEFEDDRRTSRAIAGSVTG